MTKPIRVYWDACAWISFINQEKSVPLLGGSVENRFAMCLAVIDAARKGKVEIVTSAFTLAEVCKSPEVLGSPLDSLSSYFERSYILTVPVDLAIGKAAQELQRTGLSGVKPPDAIHIASARRANVSELHTFDAKILAFDRRFEGLDGSPMRVCKPSLGTEIGPLFAK